MTDSPMARLGTSDLITRSKFIAGRRRDMVQFMLAADESAAARRTTRSRSGASAPLSGIEALVLQNPTRALATLVSDTGITTAEEDGFPRVCRHPRRMSTALGGEYRPNCSRMALKWTSFIMNNRRENHALACPHPGWHRWPLAGLQPPPPLGDRTAALQRGRDRRAEAAPPPGRRAAPRSPPRGRKGAPAGQKRAQRRNALRQMPQRNAWVPSGRV